MPAETLARSKAARAGLSLLGAVALAFLGVGPASAGLVLSPLILDISADQPARGDVELMNNGQERLYVVVSPAEVVDAGSPGERRTEDPDPEALGLLATPNRVVLEPGARKFIRIAMLKPPGAKDRIYRVTVKPVVGATSGETKGLKVVVGYEMLVIQRPAAAHAELKSERQGDVVVITNLGNTNAEIFQGKQCKASVATCEDLPSNRIYAGATVRVPAKSGFKIRYTLKVKDKVNDYSFDE